MAAVNSLLFLLTTLAPNREPLRNHPVAFETTTEWQRPSFSWNDQPGSQFNCPENEEYNNCGTACYKTCHNHDEDTDIACPYKCLSGCFCKDPMVRGLDGKCIYKEDCPELTKLNDTSSWFQDKECPRNEVYTCVCMWSPFSEKMRKSWCPGWCVPGCECIWPLVRGPEGNCIVRQNSPKPLTAPESTKSEECGPDEEMSCYSHCQKNCTNYDQHIPCPIYCVRGCICKEPMIKGPNGNCILPEQCPSSQNLLQEGPEGCADNEIYDPCGPACEYNCITRKTVCQNTECVAGCFCKPYYVRGFGGKCMMPFDCIIRDTEPSDQDYSTPSSNINDLDTFLRDEDGSDTGEYICPKNKEYTFCGTSCPEDCTNYDKDIACSGRCIPGCFCKHPMVLGPGGECIYKEECPKNLNDLINSQYDCPVNEEYKECGSACSMNCDNYDKELSCSNNCIAGCFCKDPMVRAPNGTCVYKEECSEIKKTLERGHALKSQGFLPDLPKMSCKENEEFALCASICPDNCYNYDVDRMCKHICVPGCRCKSGYVIGSDGVCMKKENCKEKIQDDCTEQEYFDNCGSRCEKDCYNIPLPECEDKTCIKGCFCKPGLVRNPRDGKCIKPIDCIYPFSHSTLAPNTETAY